MRLILASGSPRRRELLEHLGVRFEVVVSGEAEDSPQTDPARLAHELAQAKARAVARLHPDAVVIAADTVVALAGPQATTLLGKPADTQENAQFLRQQSGRTQQVYTGVCVISATGEESGVECTNVTFRTLSEAEIQFYARSGEGLDKAGGYGIQGIGMALIERIEGDYSNIVGFPVGLVLKLLRGAGIPAFGELNGL